MNSDVSCIRNAELLSLMIFALLIGVIPWSNIMEILEEKDGVDTELLVYAMTLVNKVGQCLSRVELLPHKSCAEVLIPGT